MIMSDEQNDKSYLEVVHCKYKIISSTYEMISRMYEIIIWSGRDTYACELAKCELKFSFTS